MSQRIPCQLGILVTSYHAHLHHHTKYPHTPPNMYRQHLLRITGGFMGADWQMWHVNDSISTCLRLRGIDMVLLMVKREAVSFLTWSFVLNSLGLPWKVYTYII